MGCHQANQGLISGTKYWLWGLILVLGTAGLLLWLVADGKHFFSDEEAYFWPVLMSFLENYCPAVAQKIEQTERSYLLRRLAQIPYRFVLVLLFLAFFICKWRSFPKEPLVFYTPNVLPTWALRVFYALLLFLVRDWAFLLSEQRFYKAFYAPTPLYALFFEEYPSIFFFYGFWLMAILGIFLILLGYGGFRTGLFVAAFLSFLQGFFWCFGKTDHLYASMHLLCWLMPLFFFKDIFQSPSNIKKLHFLIGMVVCVPYTLAAAEKLLQSGLSWQYSGAAWQGWVVLLFQLSALVAWQNTCYQRYFWLAAFLFHASVYMFVQVGHVLHPWWLMALVWALLGRAPISEPSEERKLPHGAGTAH